MSSIAIGLVLGFVVSIPPGPNSALCVNLASGGVRRAVPLITGAALTDAAYSLLAASGILVASQAGIGTLQYVLPLFLLATAALSWFPDSISSKAAAVVPVLNPATAAIWLGLSSIPALQALSLPEALLRPVPVALGTALWFALLATASARASVSLGPRQTLLLQKSVAGLLALGGVASLIALLT
jgi:hypothetical protein